MHGTQKTKVDLWARLAEQNPSVCLDIGANYGEFSLAAASLGAKVVALEPNPSVAACLEQTMSKFPGSQVVVSAASAEDGNAAFYFNLSSTGASSLSKEVPESHSSYLKMMEPVKTSRVPTCRLDSLVPGLLGDWASRVLLKVDVEGFEEDVLKGASGLLANAREWRAIVEFNESAIQKAGKDPDDLWRRLRNYPGILIDDNFSSKKVQPPLTAALPVVPPIEVDVLIGQGHW